MLSPLSWVPPPEPNPCEPGRLQCLQVPGRARLGETHFGRELGDAQAPGAQQAHEVEPGGVAEAGELAP
jgi:hypothetical protein